MITIKTLYRPHYLVVWFSFYNTAQSNQVKFSFLTCKFTVLFFWSREYTEHSFLSCTCLEMRDLLGFLFDKESTWHCRSHYTLHFLVINEAPTKALVIQVYATIWVFLYLTIPSLRKENINPQYVTLLREDTACIQYALPWNIDQID